MVCHIPNDQLETLRSSLPQLLPGQTDPLPNAIQSLLTEQRSESASRTWVESLDAEWIDDQQENAFEDGYANFLQTRRQHRENEACLASVYKSKVLDISGTIEQDADLTNSERNADSSSTALPEVTHIRICCLFNRIEGSGLISLSSDNYPAMFDFESECKSYEDALNNMGTAADLPKLPDGNYYRAVKIGYLGSTVALFRGRKYLIVTPYSSPVSKLDLVEHGGNPVHKSSSNSEKRKSNESLDIPFRKKIRNDRLIEEKAPCYGKTSLHATSTNSSPRPASLHETYPFDLFERNMQLQDSRNGRCGLYELHKIENISSIDLKEYSYRRDILLVCMSKSHRVGCEHGLVEEAIDYRQCTLPLEFSNISPRTSNACKQPIEKDKSLSVHRPAICRCEIVRKKAYMHIELLGKFLKKYSHNLEVGMNELESHCESYSENSKIHGNRWRFFDLFQGPVNVISKAFLKDRTKLDPSSFKRIPSRQEIASFLLKHFEQFCDIYLRLILHLRLVQPKRKFRAEYLNPKFLPPIYQPVNTFWEINSISIPQQFSLLTKRMDYATNINQFVPRCQASIVNRLSESVQAFYFLEKNEIDNAFKELEKRLSEVKASQQKSIPRLKLLEAIRHMLKSRNSNSSNQSRLVVMNLSGQSSSSQNNTANQEPSNHSALTQASGVNASSIEASLPLINAEISGEKENLISLSEMLWVLQYGHESLSQAAKVITALASFSPLRLAPSQSKSTFEPSVMDILFKNLAAPKF